jgi:NAD(P)-dependent dehydrogenase (short-subunit alcohol dehydrogenase family)
MAVVLITGCSSGFGLSAALAFARLGDEVYAGVRRIDSATQLQRAAAEEGLAVSVVQVDVTDIATMQACVDTIAKESGGIDVLVNNAGISQVCPVEDVHVADARLLMETHYFGPLQLIQLVLPLMRASGGGSIVNLSSVSGQVRFPCTGAYGASKAALEALSEALSLEVAPFGIRVSVVQPGNFPTAIQEKALPTPTSRAYEGATERLLEGRDTTLAGPGSNEVVASAIVDAARNAKAPFRIPVGTDAESILGRRDRTSEADFLRYIARVSARVLTPPK